MTALNPGQVLQTGKKKKTTQGRPEIFEIQLPKETSKGAEVIIHISLNEYYLIHISFELPDKNFKQEYDMKRQVNMDGKTESTI